MKSKISKTEFINLIFPRIEAGESWTKIAQDLKCTSSAVQQRYKNLSGTRGKKKKNYFPIWEHVPDFQSICLKFVKYSVSIHDVDPNNLYDFCVDFSMNPNKSFREFLKNSKRNNKGGLLFHTLKNRFHLFLRKKENNLIILDDEKIEFFQNKFNKKI